jgi:hypothetical protein
VCRLGVLQCVDDGNDGWVSTGCTVLVVSEKVGRSCLFENSVLMELTLFSGPAKWHAKHY